MSIGRGQNHYLTLAKGHLDFKITTCFSQKRGWSGSVMVLGKLPVPGRPTIWVIVGQGPIALVVGAGGGLFGHLYLRLPFLSFFFLSLGDGPI